MSAENKWHVGEYFSLQTDIRGGGMVALSSFQRTATERGSGWVSTYGYSCRSRRTGWTYPEVRARGAPDRTAPSRRG
eukprot:4168194-Prymnesium_polylepis.1